mgnify:CR=1 FL=1
MKRDLKSVIVTGGLGLLGWTFSKYLEKIGFHVIIIDIAEEPDSIKNFDNMTYIKFNLLEQNRFSELKLIIKNVTNNLKVLINNAAFNPKIEDDNKSFGRFEDLNINEWNREISLNLTTPTFLIQNLLDLFNHKDNDNCKIINIVSTYGLVPPNQDIYKVLSKAAGKEIIKPIGYPVTKAGLVMVTKYLATYLGDKGFNINGIAPGGIENGQPIEFIEEYSKYTPMKRMADKKDMLGVLELLSTNKSEYINGQIIAVDGGWTIW